MFKSKEVQLAKSALDLTENGAFNDAMKTLEAVYIKAWKDSPVRDEEAREKLYMAVGVLGKVQDHLQTHVDNGKLHEASSKQIRKDFK